jgi:hypothetical protein
MAGIVLPRTSERREYSRRNPTSGLKRLREVALEPDTKIR